MKLIWTILLTFVTVIIMFFIVSILKRSARGKRMKSNHNEPETFSHCVPTWPSKCFDCDAEMCAGQHKTNSALASSGLANLGRM